LNDVFKLVHERTQEPIDNPIAAAIQENTTIYLEENLQLIAKDGTAIPIADSVAPIQDNRGELAAVAIVFRDITQRRLAEERNLALERAHQLEVQMTELNRLNRLKDDFLNTISHELRTPLSNIKMAVRLLEMVLNQRGLLSPETLSDSQSMARYLNILQDQCNQELKLINDLLDMRAIDAEAYPLDLTPIQLQDWIPHIVESFTERATVQQQSLHVHLPTELPVLVSDISILTRVLTELLNNALKYTPSGEQIVVNVRVVEESSEKGDKGEPLPSPICIQIEVSNSGIQLPQEELSRIFEPFYRIPKNDPWKHGGTGLGLALVKKLVNCLRGKIEAKSDRNWTTFSLEIPSLGLSVEAADDDFNGHNSSEL
jgi:signal transduction histidine kinase